MAYLLDTNILLRFVHRKSAEHPTVRAAIRKIRAAGDMMHFAPQNAAEAWNVATRPVAKNGFGFTPADADRMLRLLERLFVLLPDTPALYPKWRSLVLDAQVSYPFSEKHVQAYRRGRYPLVIPAPEPGSRKGCASPFLDPGSSPG